jgi:hypothetical protein
VLAPTLRDTFLRTVPQGEVVLVRSGRLYVAGIKSDAFSAMALVAA